MGCPQKIVSLPDSLFCRIRRRPGVTAVGHGNKPLVLRRNRMAAGGSARLDLAMRATKESGEPDSAESFECRK